MYNEFIEYILPVLGTALSALLSALLGYLVSYINKKKDALIEQVDSDIADKYIQKISETITDCVIATNQTYVEALKKEGAFTKEAQEEAFNKTLNNVLAILGEDCIDYLKTITSDVEAYLKNKIEAEVNLNKGI